MNNSVIILGINNYTKNIYLNNVNISFIFNNCSDTKYFNLYYTCNDLSKLNINENSTEDKKPLNSLKMNIYQIIMKKHIK